MAKLNNGEGLAMNLGSIMVVIVAVVGVLTSVIHVGDRNI